MELKDYIALSSAGIALLSAGIALYAIHRTGVLAALQTSLQQRLNEESKKLDNRRFFSVLWDKMTDLNHIDPKAPIEPDVRKAVNALEVTAIFWQAGIVDKQMVVLAFGKLFDELFTEIDQAGQIPHTGKTGHQMLHEDRAISVVHKQIQDELNKQGVITP